METVTASILLGLASIGCGVVAVATHDWSAYALGLVLFVAQSFIVIRKGLSLRK